MVDEEEIAAASAPQHNPNPDPTPTLPPTSPPQMVDEEEIAAASAASAEGGEYINDADPSILRFLIAAREEVRPLGTHGWQAALGVCHRPRLCSPASRGHL